MVFDRNQPRRLEHLLVPATLFLLRSLLHRRSVLTFRSDHYPAASEEENEVLGVLRDRLAFLSANQHLLGCSLPRRLRGSPKASKRSTGHRVPPFADLEICGVWQLATFVHSRSHCR